ncbi:hypothetical protein [uncultured Methanobrevibacter sp.]|uniref:hypothetical protein n=1 Tax=uncultured Methanobrevibacter sp. TaxID=253161 RepID=UPI0025DE3C79|nr:hypothetical protein [uncultured Methanobrevibacter sp.]
MENKNIIIILLVIIVILAAAIGFMLFNQPTVAKEPTKIKITSDKEQYEGGKLSIELTDLNKTPLSKEIVNITITNKKGKVVVDDVVKTNSKGKAKLDLDLKKGKYKVNVSYGGNENYTGNNTTQKLTIKEEEVVEAAVENVNSQDSVSQADGNGMPEETRKIYAARQKAADDGIPMYEYIHSPELVEKYQAMV